MAEQGVDGLGHRAFFYVRRCRFNPADTHHREMSSKQPDSTKVDSNLGCHQGQGREGMREKHQPPSES